MQEKLENCFDPEKKKKKKTGCKTPCNVRAVEKLLLLSSQRRHRRRRRRRNAAAAAPRAAGEQGRFALYVAWLPIAHTWRRVDRAPCWTARPELYACSWHSWRSLKASSSISAASHLVALCFAAQAAALAVHAPPLCAHRYEKLKNVQNLSDDLYPFIR